jgi:predicted metal-dependent enzyme (double-stranded beta helix superfamily)
MTDIRDVTNSPENRIQALTTHQLSTLVRQLAAQPDVWLPRLRLPESRQRWWTQLWSGPVVDVWLLSWLPGHATDLHDHGPSAAAFAVVRGELNEVRIAAGARRVTVPRRLGSTTALGVGVIHDVRGAGSRSAVSIHAYSPPLERMTYYEIDQRGRPRAQSTLETHEPEQVANG